MPLLGCTVALTPAAIALPISVRRVNSLIIVTPQQRSGRRCVVWAHHKGNCTFIPLPARLCPHDPHSPPPSGIPIALSRGGERPHEQRFRGPLLEGHRSLGCARA